MLHEVSSDQREVHHLKRDLIRYRFKKDADIFSEDIKVSRVYFVENQGLRDDYIAKKSNLRDEGKTKKETGEKLGFLVQHQWESAVEICEKGLVARSGSNTLGDSTMGVYLWRHPDLCLKSIIPNMTANMRAYVVIFKVRIKKHT